MGRLLLFPAICGDCGGSGEIPVTVEELPLLNDYLERAFGKKSPVRELVKTCPQCLGVGKLPPGHPKGLSKVAP